MFKSRVRPSGVGAILAGLAVKIQKTMSSQVEQ